MAIVVTTTNQKFYSEVKAVPIFVSLMHLFHTTMLCGKSLVADPVSIPSETN